MAPSAIFKRPCRARDRQQLKVVVMRSAESHARHLAASLGTRFGAKFEFQNDFYIFDFEFFSGPVIVLSVRIAGSR